MLVPDDIKKIAKNILEASKERDVANKVEDYDLAFNIECDQ